MDRAAPATRRPSAAQRVVARAQRVGVRARARVRRRARRRAGRVIASASARPRSAAACSVANVLGQVGVHLGESRRRAGAASPAKSPPTSSACRSASANRSRTLASARSQPSLAVRRNSWSIAEVDAAPPSSVGQRPSIQPRAARCARTPASVSASWISMSGLSPGLILRNTLRSESSPKATEELDCSPHEQRRVRRPGRARDPASRWNVSARRLVAASAAKAVAASSGHRLAVVERRRRRATQPSSASSH